MEEIKDLFGQELLSQIENLSNLSPGSQEHSAAVKSVNEMYKLRIEELKAEWEYSEKFDRREMEEKHLKKEEELKEKQLKSDEEFKTNQLKSDEDFKKKQIEEMKSERYFKYGVEVALAIGGWVFFNCQTNKGYRFEQTGTILSHTFKNVLRGVKLRR